MAVLRVRRPKSSRRQSGADWRPHIGAGVRSRPGIIGAIIKLTSAWLRPSVARESGSPFDEMFLVMVFGTKPSSQVVATTFSSGSPRTKRSMFRATSRERGSIVPSVRGEQ